MERSYTEQEAKIIADKYLNNKLIPYSDLPDIEYPELRNGMTMKEITEECDRAYENTVQTACEDMDMECDFMDLL